MKLSSYRRLALLIGVAVVLACFGAGRAHAQVQPEGKPAGAKESDEEKRARLIAGGKEAVEKAMKIKELYEDIGHGGLDNLKRMSDGLDGMSKVGKCLGIAGAAIGMTSSVLEMFGVTESDAEKQRNMLKEISSKIDNLEAKMTSRFDSLDKQLQILDAKIQAGFAKTQIFPFVITLDVLQGTVEKYYTQLAAIPRDDDKVDLIAGNLAKYQTKDILDAVDAIESSVLGKNFAADLLQADLDSNFGDMGRLAESSYLLTKLINQAGHNYALVQVLQMKRNNEYADAAKNWPITHPGKPLPTRSQWEYNRADTIAADANTTFVPILNEIAGKLKEYMKTAAPKRDENVKNYLKDRFGGTPNTDKTRVIRRVMHVTETWLPEGAPSTGFKKTSDPKTSAPIEPYTTNDYSKKYGTLADDLKAKYLCDWLVLVYHPMNRMDEGKFTGLADFSNWNWSGTNCIWFLEEDPDFKTEGSNLVFLLVQRSESPAPKFGANINRKSFAEWKTSATSAPPAGLPKQWPGLDFADLDRSYVEPPKGKDEIRERSWSPWLWYYTRVLHEQLGQTEVNSLSGKSVETGLVLEFKVGSGQMFRGTELVSFDQFTSKFASPELKGYKRIIEPGTGVWTSTEEGYKRDGVLSSPDVRQTVLKQFGGSGGIQNQWVGLYGAMYLKTTTPTRLVVQQGKGKLIILHGNVNGLGVDPSRYPPLAPDSISLRGAETIQKEPTVGGPVQYLIEGVPYCMTEAPNYRFAYEAGSKVTAPVTFWLTTDALHSEKKFRDTGYCLVMRLPDGKWVASTTTPTGDPTITLNTMQVGNYEIYAGMRSPTGGKNVGYATLRIKGSSK